MNYCVVDGFRYPDERSRCRICGRQLVDADQTQDLPENVVAILSTSCCPNPNCASLIAPAKVNFCALCGVKLESITYELWQKKIVMPAIKEDLANVLVDPASLLKTIAIMGLSVSVARNRLDSVLEELMGVTRNVLDSWIEESIRLLQENQKREAAEQQAIREARKLNMRLLPATAIVEELSRKAKVLTEASTSEHIKDPSVAEPIKSPPSNSGNRVLKMRKRNRGESESDSPKVVRHDVAGNLLVLPAVITEVGSDWRVREKEELEIDHVAKIQVTFPDPEPEPAKLEQDEPQQELPIVQPPVERRIRLIIGIVVSLILLGALLIGIHSGDPSGAVENRNRSPIPSPPINMVLVPGGQFQMGNEAGDKHERPAHKVVVKPFFMDIYEVTCEEYQKFVKATGHRPPSNWIGNNHPGGATKKPVTGVDWDDATAYASWAGKRLPTEEEWEFTAKGTDERRYPWGNFWRPGATNAGELNVGHFTDVGSYPDGKSPFGVMDMVGNAWEWTATEWQAYTSGPSSPNVSSESHVIRGGFWGSSSPKATTTFRRGWQSRGAIEGYENTGFRCAADVAAPTGKK